MFLFLKQDVLYLQIRNMTIIHFNENFLVCLQYVFVNEAIEKTKCTGPKGKSSTIK